MPTQLLRTLATNFDANAVMAAKAIREVYSKDPVNFPRAAAEILRTSPDLPGTSYLLAVLVAETDWLRTVCDPQNYTLGQCLALVKRARKIDPATEVKLAKMLTSLNSDGGEEAKVAARVLEVLGSCPDSSTALAALHQLSHSRNGHIRSKAALLMGRISRNPQWAEAKKSELDPRVSANAVESLWGLNTPAAREGFLSAALNEHHRVAANGIVGLYLMGDETSLPFLFHLSKSTDAFGRAAAAWAMGRVLDARFLPRLSRLMSDPDEMVRKRAFKSVSEVRKAMVEMRAAGVLRVQLRDVECRGKSHRLRLAVTKDGKLVKGFDARQFIVSSGPDVVEEFSCLFKEGTVSYYEIAYQGSPSPTNLVKVQVYARDGVGEDTGFEMAFE